MSPRRDSSDAEITDLLGRWHRGDSEALERLMPRIYGRLQQLARRAMRRERPDHTLQATALVHEMFVRLAAGTSPNWQDRHHFFSLAARLMRHILVDHARNVRSQRRGGDVQKLTLGALDLAPVRPAVDLLDLDRALERLAAVDPRKARVIELRCFAGLSVAETAALLEVSEPTVILDTRLARAWLYERLHRGRDEPPGASSA